MKFLLNSLKTRQPLKRSFSMKTTLNPNRQRPFQIPTNNFYRSLLIISTPSQLRTSIDGLINFKKQNPNFQTILISLDSVLNSPNGFSELWLNDPIDIKSYKRSKDTDKKQEDDEDRTSVEPIRFDKQWKVNDPFKNKVNICFDNNNHIFQMSLANTLFSTGLNTTCFFSQPFENKDNWMNLSELSIELPNLKCQRDSTIFYYNKLKEIKLSEKEKETEFMITDFEGNLIKAINNIPASQYLIENKEIQKTKQDLFLKLYANPENKTELHKDRYFKIVAGALGWGEKQALIALDPLCTPLNYHSVKLYQHDPLKKSEPFDRQLKSIVIECSNQWEDYNDGGHNNQNKADEVVVDNVLGLGSEHGVLLDNVWHKSYGETIQIPIS